MHGVLFPRREGERENVKSNHPYQNPYIEKVVAVRVTVLLNGPLLRGQVSDRGWSLSKFAKKCGVSAVHMLEIAKKGKTCSKDLADMIWGQLLVPVAPSREEKET